MTAALRGEHVAAAGHPLCTSAGIATLAGGGSAVDAVLAMAFTQWVVSGPTCGPGGDLIVMHVEGRHRRPRVTVYGGWSRAPRRLRSEHLTSRGPLSAVVPGAMSGADAAWRHVGRVPWEQLFTHALEAADGHRVTPWMARCYAEVERKGHAEALSRVLDQSTVPAEGDLVSCSRLGASLQRLASLGASDLYRGGLGEQLVRAAEADGALLRADDLAAMAAVVGEPAVRDVGGMTVSVLPPPSQAPIVLDLLSAVSADAWPHERRYADVVAPLTKQGLIDRCVVGVPGTAVSIAADGDSAAVVIHSLAGVQYGSGWVAGETGIALGNRVGTALSARPDLPAANPVPGGVLPHTLSAALFEIDGAWMLIATPGGDRQVQWLAQAGQRFRHGSNACSVDGVVSDPRWFVCPEGDRFGVPAGIDREWFMFAEPGVDWREDGRAAGFAVRPVENVGGGLQAVSWDGSPGWSVASDPRSGGSAAVGEGDRARPEEGLT